MQLHIMKFLRRFIMHSYLRCKLETGRTHQIRVHMSHNTSPIVGDQTYGLKKIIPTKEISLALKEQPLTFLDKHFIQFSWASFIQRLKKICCGISDLPEDMKNLLDLIRHESSISSNVQ